METFETVEPIDYWLELNRRAMYLKPKRYQQWQFIVGSTGSLEERIKLGQKALEILQPKSIQIVVVNESKPSISVEDFEAKILKVIRSSS